MIPLLILAIALSTLSVVLQLREHSRFSAWADSQQRLWCAHKRLVDKVYGRSMPPTPVDRRPTTVWPQRQPAPEPEDWADDFHGTSLFPARARGGTQ